MSERRERERERESPPLHPRNCEQFQNKFRLHPGNSFQNNLKSVSVCVLETRLIPNYFMSACNLAAPYGTQLLQTALVLEALPSSPPPMRVAP